MPVRLLPLQFPYSQFASSCTGRTSLCIEQWLAELQEIVGISTLGFIFFLCFIEHIPLVWSDLVDENSKFAKVTVTH